MKFHVFSILAGIGQAILVFIYTQLLFFVVDRWIADWMMTGNRGTAIMALSLVICSFLVLTYPVYLYKHHQKWDAIVVLISSIVTIGIWFSAIYYMVSQLALMD